MVELIKVWLVICLILAADFTRALKSTTPGYTDAKLKKLEAQVNELSNQLSELNNFRKGLRANIKASTIALFLPSEQFEGRRYWLTKSVLPVSFDIAEVICEVHGGYLAEIDSDDEFSFIQSYLTDSNLFTTIIVGATDEVTEGYWVNTYHKTEMNNTNWGTDEPNGGTAENCLCYYQYSYELLLNDCQCHKTNDYYKAGYLCEIPE